MSQQDPKDSQPNKNPTPHVRRQYVPAVWAPPGMGTGHPKLSGGVTIDEHGNIIAARAYNRPDQRYAISADDALSRRLSRAVSEYSDTVILRGSNNSVEVRSKSGNNYDLPSTLTACDCPDFLRLGESYDTFVPCKHILMAQTAVSVVIGYGNLDWAVSYLAEVIGVEERTAQTYCEKGEVYAFKRHNVWIIPQGHNLMLNVEQLRAKIIGTMPDLPFVTEE